VSFFFSLPIVLVIFIICVSFFKKFWEGVLAGVLLDVTYEQISFGDFSFSIFSLIFVAIILIAEKIKGLIWVRP